MLPLFLRPTERAIFQKHELLHAMLAKWLETQFCVVPATSINKLDSFGSGTFGGALGSLDSGHPHSSAAKRTTGMRVFMASPRKVVCSSNHKSQDTCKAMPQGTRGNRLQCLLRGVK